MTHRTDSSRTDICRPSKNETYQGAGGNSSPYMQEMEQLVMLGATPFCTTGYATVAYDDVVPPTTQ